MKTEGLGGSANFNVTPEKVPKLGASGPSEAPGAISYPAQGFNWVKAMLGREPTTPRR